MLRTLLLTMVVCICDGSWQETQSHPLASQEKRAIVGDTEKKLDAGSYRLSVECILEPREDIAIYRVHAFAIGKRELFLHLANGQLTEEGVFRRQDDVKPSEGTFVLVLEIKDRMKEKVFAQYRCVAIGRSGLTNLIYDIDPAVKLHQILDLKPTDQSQKLGTKVKIGRFRDMAIELEVR